MVSCENGWYASRNTEQEQEYRAGEITREEYFGGKLNCPDTWDDLDKVTPTIKWRKNK